MKNIVLLSFLIFISTFAFGQSVLIEPATSAKPLVVKATNATYGNFSTTSASGADLFFRLSATGDGSAGTIIGAVQTFPTKFQISSNTNLSLYTGSSDKMYITSAGLVGIGTITPQSNLHLHNPTTGTSSILQLTNETIGSTITDGLYIGENNFGNASIFNQESGSLRLGTNGSAYFALQNEKACLSCLTPTGKFDIWHNTSNANSNPHITLRTTTDASNGIVRMENSTGSRFFGQYFSVGSATAANNFLSFDYNGSTPILDLAGNGNVQIAGFTKLGGAAAPSIKMKKLTGTTSASQGGNVSIAHGIADPSKIISINVLVRYNGSNADAWVGNGYTGAAGFEFSYQYDGGNIFIVNTPANSANILSKDIKIVVTYEE